MISISHNEGYVITYKDDKCTQIVYFGIGITLEDAINKLSESIIGNMGKTAAM